MRHNDCFSGMIHDCGGDNMSITQFTMEEARCFAERQQFEIRP